MIRVAPRWQPLLCALASFGVILAVWQLAVDLGYVKAFFVSTPTRIAVELARQAASGELVENLRVSLSEFAAGLLLAVAIGGALGVLASWSRTFEHVLEPFIWFKYSSPTIAFYPMFVAWLGLGEPTIIAIAFLFAVTPIYANTLSGIKNTDPDLVRCAVAFGARRRDVFLKVQLPASVPILIAGLRLSVGRALTGVIAAELFGATAGLGFSIAYWGQKLRTTEMMASLVVVIALGVLVTQALSALEARVDSWRTGPGREQE
jgi:NitT/TauT family transport system permease protein